MPEGILEVTGPNNLGDDVRNHRAWNFMMCSNFLSQYQGKNMLTLHLCKNNFITIPDGRHRLYYDLPQPEAAELAQTLVSNNKIGPSPIFLLVGRQSDNRNQQCPKLSLSPTLRTITSHPQISSAPSTTPSHLRLKSAWSITLASKMLDVTRMTMRRSRIWRRVVRSLDWSKTRSIRLLADV